MISVNLLPQSLRVKKKAFAFPIFPILTLGIGVLFLIYLILRIQILSGSRVVKDMALDLESVSAKSNEATQLKNQILKMNGVVEGIFLKTLLPRYSVTLILNEINRQIPEGMWLQEVDLYAEDGRDYLRVDGFVKPETSESMIATIGRFNSGLRDFMARMKSEFPVYLTDGLFPALELGEDQKVEFSVTTKRRQAENLEITEFSTLFTL